MIIDQIKNVSLYFGLGDKITTALKFLKENDFSQMEPGRYEINGSDVYAMINFYENKPQKEGSWEAHRQYIDVHFIVEGAERMGYANLDQMKALQDYKPNEDFLLLEGSGDFFTVRQGTFVIFGPTDAHMPGLAINKPQAVKKVVVKVKIDSE